MNRFRNQLQQAMDDAQSAVDAKNAAYAAEQTAKRERSARMFAPVASCLNGLASDLSRDKEIAFVDDSGNGRYLVHLHEKGWSLVRQHYIVSVEFKGVSDEDFRYCLSLHGGLELFKGEASLNHFLDGGANAEASQDFGLACDQHLTTAVIALIAAFKTNKRHESDFGSAAKLIFRQFSEAVSH